MTDIQMDDNGSLKFKNGDFEMGESTLQEVANILSCVQGEFKNDPLTGLNLFMRVNSKYDRLELDREVRIQIERDRKNYDRIKSAVRLNPKLN